MNIQIHSVRFDADKKLIDFLHQKLEKLTQFGEDIVKPILDIPVEIMIEVESRCNFQCSFCFNKISFAKKWSSH